MIPVYLPRSNRVVEFPELTPVLVPNRQAILNALRKNEALTDAVFDTTTLADAPLMQNMFIRFDPRESTPIAEFKTWDHVPDYGEGRLLAVRL